MENTEKRPSIEDVVDFLEKNQNNNSFYLSLLTQFNKKGYLSEKQVNCVVKNMPGGYAASNNPAYKAGDCIKISCKQAKLLKSRLNMELFFRNLKIEEVIRETSASIEAKVSFISQVSNSCHVCGRELDNDISKATGIGPVCARNINVAPKNELDAAEILTKFDELCKSFGVIGPVFLQKRYLEDIAFDIIADDLTDSKSKDDLGEVA